MASSNKDDSSIIDTTKSKSSLNVIRGDSQQQHTEYNIETDSIQEYEPSLNDESNSRLSNVGDKVVETVKVKFCTKALLFYMFYLEYDI